MITLDEVRHIILWFYSAMINSMDGIVKVYIKLKNLAEISHKSEKYANKKLLKKSFWRKQVLFGDNTVLRQQLHVQS